MSFRYLLSGFIALLLLVALPALSQGDRIIRPADSGVRESRGGPDIVSLALDCRPSPGGGSFFRNYQLLGAQRSSLGAQAVPSMALRLSGFEPFRLVISASYSSSTFEDLYTVPDTTVRGSGAASSATLLEKFSASGVAGTIGLEYWPIETQFTTYVGLAAGLALCDVDWSTVTLESSRGEYSRPTLNTKGSSFAPVFRFYGGIEYRFDRYDFNNSLVRGIFLEAGFLTIPVQRDYFATVRQQGRGLPLLPEDNSASLDMGGFTLTLGVNLQLFRR